MTTVTTRHAAVCATCGADADYPGLHDPETGQWHDLDQLIDDYSFAFELAAPYRARWGDAEPARPVIVGGRCERCRERGAPCTG